MISRVLHVGAQAPCACALHAQCKRRRASEKQGSRPVAARAEAETTSAEAAVSTAEDTKPEAPEPGADGDWVPVMPPEDLPKGVRKEVNVNDQSILLFWYRNQIYAISSRSPAEGAYSEGFIKAKFTQDYGIVCPATQSVFSLKDGSIMEWYPSNPVLRAVTPQSNPLPIFPVKLTQDNIMVNVNSSASRIANMRGGADTSLENNNVFAVQPSVYTQGSDVDDGTGSAPQTLSTVLTFTVAIAAFAITATAGTATALYYEDYVLLGGFWLLLAMGGTYFGFQYVQNKKSE